MRGWGLLIAVVALFACLSVFLSGGTTVLAEVQAPPDTLGAGPTLTGLSGLVVTESAHTLPPWSVAVGATGLYSRLDSPRTSLYEAAGLVGLGLPGHIELSAVLPGLRFDPSGGSAETGLGDLQLSGKWRALHQNEVVWPALAVAMTVTLPTGQVSKGLNTPLGPVPGNSEHYGMAFKVIISADIDFTPDQYAVGLYAESGLYIQDLNDSTQDKYGMYALGAALPLVMRPESPLTSPLQLLLEVNGTYKRGAEQDFVTVWPSLRFVGPNYNGGYGPITITGGFQYTAIQHSSNALGGVVQVGFVFR